MRARLRRGYVAIAVIACATVLLSVSAVAPAISSTVDFSIFNSGWNGTSGLAVSTYKLGKFAPSFQVKSTGTELQVVQIDLNQLTLDPVSSALVEIGPSLPFTAADGRIVGDFLRGGGMLLLADDFGTGNSLLEKMGATSRISGRLVMDLAFDKKPQFPVCYDLRTSPLTANVTSLLLNYPSSLIINGTNTTPLAFTSVASWLDTNNNGRMDPGEPMGPFPLLAEERLGSGTIILLSDPSVLINGMQAYRNDSVFARNVLSVLCTGRSSVYFDESHRNFFSPVVITAKFTGSISTTAKGALAVIAFVLSLWIATDYVDKAVAIVLKRALALYSWFVRVLFFWRKPAPAAKAMTVEELEAEVKRRHPDWRPGVIHYIVKESERHSKIVLEHEGRAKA